MIFFFALYDCWTVFTMNSLYIPRLDKMKMSWDAVLLRSRGRGFVISMHLSQEYARITTTNTDNKRNIYEQVR